MALLGRQQARFVGALARETGLDPRVVGAWALAEENGSAARGYEQRGYHNYLNIARTDSGDAHGAHSAVWSDPLRAARATAEWLKGQGQIAHEYGRPAAGIMRILGTKGAAGQISAIANSGWASSGYEGGSTLRSLFHSLGGERIPNETAGGGGGGEGAGGGTTTTRSPAGTSPAQLATLMALMDAGNAPNPAQDVSSVTLRKPGEQGLHTPAPAAEAPGRDLNSLLAMIDQIGEQGEAPRERTETTTEGAGGAGGGGGGGAYVNPLPGFKKGRVDQGVDYSGRPGMAIRAMGNGRVLGVSPDWYEGQPYVYYELTDGPQRGKVIYVAEQIAPRVRAGDRVRAGQTIGTYASHGTALETGYGTHTGGRVEDPYAGRPDGTETAAGLRYKRVLEGLGAR